jgi:hypothetical protein
MTERDLALHVVSTVASMLVLFTLSLAAGAVLNAYVGMLTLYEYTALVLLTHISIRQR